MIKKVICLVIIASMILHCSSRLGVLSYLYKKRHEIALAAGIITEVPIALCSSEFNFSNDLTIESTPDGDQLPPAFLNAQEITLFFVSIQPILSASENSFPKKQSSIYTQHPYVAPTFSIFHPPSV